MHQAIRLKPSALCAHTQTPGDQPVGSAAAGAVQAACAACTCADASPAAGGSQQLAAASSAAAVAVATTAVGDATAAAEDAAGGAWRPKSSPYELPPLDLARLFNGQELLSGIVWGQDTW